MNGKAGDLMARVKITYEDGTIEFDTDIEKLFKELGKEIKWLAVREPSGEIRVIIPTRRIKLIEKVL